MPPVKQESVVFSAVLEMPVVAVLMQRSGEVQAWEGAEESAARSSAGSSEESRMHCQLKKSSHRPLEFLRRGRNVGFNTSFYPLPIHKAAVAPAKLTPHQQVGKINPFSSAFIKCLDSFVINDIKEATRKLIIPASEESLSSVLKRDDLGTTCWLWTLKKNIQHLHIKLALLTGCYMRQRCYQNQNQAKPKWIRISFRHWQFHSCQNILLQIFWTGICLSREYLMVSEKLEGEQKNPCEDLQDNIVSVGKPCGSLSLAVFLVQTQNISYGSECFFPLCYAGGRERKRGKISWPDLPFWFLRPQ